MGSAFSPARGSGARLVCAARSPGRRGGQGSSERPRVATASKRTSSTARFFARRGTPYRSCRTAVLQPWESREDGRVDGVQLPRASLAVRLAGESRFARTEDTWYFSGWSHGSGSTSVHTGHREGTALPSALAGTKGLGGLLARGAAWLRALVAPGPHSGSFSLGPGT